MSDWDTDKDTYLTREEWERMYLNVWTKPPAPTDKLREAFDLHREKIKRHDNEKYEEF